jgi:TP901 family phage tail tape measure protein
VVAVSANDKSVRVIITATAAGFIAEIRKAQAATKDLEAQLGKASKTQEWKSAATDIGRVGLALTAVVGLAVAAWANFDQQMSSVAATGDDARASLDALRATALKAGADTKYSATEAAAGEEALLKAGVAASDVLGGALDGALSLAAAGNLNVADSAEVAATAMTQFGLKGSDVGHIADLLAAGAGKAQGEVSDMAAALKQSGLVASQAGLTIEETTGTLTAFAAAGLIGSDAGTSFRTMLMRLMNPTKESAGLMEQYGIKVYDTNGKFVTMTDLAGQLQTKLGGLDESTRNAALSIIFGSDALRAANVLYTDGGKGIADWTDKINVAGFAGKVAGEKMNNLKGDIEQLMGSFDTLAIKSGEAAGGSLRSLTQQLTELVNLAGRHPEVTQGILATVGALGGFALVAAGVMKTVTAVSEFRAATALLTASSPRTAGAIMSMSDAAGKAALTLAATAAAAKVLTNTAEMPGVDQAKRSLSELAASGNDASGALTSVDAIFKDPTAFGGSTEIVNGVDSLASAFDRLDNRAPGVVAGDFLSGIVRGLIGQKTEIQLVTDQFSKLDQAMTEIDVKQARAAFSKVAATKVHFDPTWTQGARDEAISVDRLIQLFPEYKAQLEKTAIALGITNLTNAEYVDWMGGKIPPAIAAASAAAQAGKGPHDGLNSALTAQELAAKNAAQAQADLAGQIRDSANAALAASGSEIGYQAAIDDAAAAIEKNGATLDINSEKGRANRSALDGIASSALAMTDANAKAGAGSDVLTAQMATARQSFIDTAIRMGMTADQAKALADKYGLIPGTVKTNVETNAAEAQAKVDALKARIDQLAATPAKLMITSIFDSQGYDAAQAALQRWQAGLSVKPGVSYAAKPMTFAGGGMLVGPGTGTSDSIPFMGSNGEYIVNAAATAQYRSLLDAINYGRRLPGFANGGLLQAAPASYSSSTAVTVGAANVGVTVLLDGEQLDARTRVIVGDESAKINRARTRSTR